MAHDLDGPFRCMREVFFDWVDTWVRLGGIGLVFYSLSTKSIWKGKCYRFLDEFWPRMKGRLATLLCEKHFSLVL